MNEFAFSILRYSWHLSHVKVICANHWCTIAPLSSMLSLEGMSEGLIQTNQQKQSEKFH